MFPSNGVMTWRPLLSTGSLGMVPPLQRYYGTLRLPAVHLDPFDVFRSRYHRVARGLLPSVVGVPPGARELSVPVSPSGLTMETSGSLRFLGNPGGHCPCSSTPVGSGRLSGPRVSCLTRPPPVSRAIPKCRYAAVRLECFLVDGCVDISSPSSSAFNSARHAGGSQRHSVFRSSPLPPACDSGSLPIDLKERQPEVERPLPRLLPSRRCSSPSAAG